MSDSAKHLISFSVVQYFILTYLPIIKNNKITVIMITQINNYFKLII